ncbi:MULTISPECIES: hypothetical protein [Micromonospora]|uniref:Uncharacterized protein n=1 Tax=Micromonospora acroterricola TaxID=2202421 RepID=A0A317D2N6_9ACTN|nr:MULTISPECIES: hypothetical protein [Micromonospora]MBQ0977848.1 hypothetical protein [Micromonospora sp. M61]PWR08979.1 hypothetical protein DKT68_13380 [Micromonospora acroterricola]
MTVEQYWTKTDDELYALLGAELLGEGVGLSPEDDESHRRFGKEWFSNKHRELQRKVCHDERIQPLLGTTGSDRLVDAITVAETLRLLDDASLPAIGLVAVLIARVGLGEFCRNAPQPR